MGIKGRNQKKLVHLLLQQNGNCQSCGDAITSQTRWTLQNTVPRVLGESDKFSNRVLVHENCHGLFDSRSLKAV
jgi:RNA-directed DNA polymerase